MVSRRSDRYLKYFIIQSNYCTWSHRTEFFQIMKRLYNRSECCILSKNWAETHFKNLHLVTRETIIFRMITICSSYFPFITAIVIDKWPPPLRAVNGMQGIINFKNPIHKPQSNSSIKLMVTTTLRAILLCQQLPATGISGWSWLWRFRNVVNYVYWKQHTIQMF